MKPPTTRTRFRWPSSLPVLIAAVWAAVVLLAPTGVWIAVGLLAQVAIYLAGWVDGRRAVEAATDARIRSETRALAEQLAQLERTQAEHDEADHAAIHDPPRARSGDLVNPAYRSTRRTYDSPTDQQALNRKQPRTEVQGHPTARSIA